MKKVKLESIVELADSGTWGDEASPETGNPILRSSNIHNSKLFIDDVAWRSIPQKDINRKKLQDGDIIVTASSGSPELIGKCAFFKKPDDAPDYYFSNFTFRLRANRDKVVPKFLFHWLISDKARSYLKMMNDTTSGLRNLNKSRYLQQDIPLLSPDEQCHIAAILDKADALREKRRQAINKLDTLLQAVFLNMFGDPVKNPKGWDVYDLGRVCDFISGSTLPEGEPFDNQTDGYLLLKVSDMNLLGNEIFIKHSQRWSPTPAAKSTLCPANAVVIPKRGGAIGTNKKRLLTRAAVLDPNLMGIVPKESTLKPSFLFWWLQRFDLLSITSGSSVPQLNKQDLAPLPIAVPPIPLQNDFHIATGRLFALRNKLQNAEDLASNLFTSLQQRAFNGELSNGKAAGLPRKPVTTSQPELFD